MTATPRRPSLSRRFLDFMHGHVWAVVPDHFSQRTIRLAAVVWGGALILLGLWLRYDRLHDGRPLGLAPSILPAAGSSLVLILFAPGPNERAFLWILRVFAIVGYLVSTVMMTLSFYLVVTPLGWLLKAMGKDPLRLAPGAQPAWHPHPDHQDRRRYFRLF